MLNGPSWGGSTDAVQAKRAYDGPTTAGERERELESLHETVRALNGRLDAIGTRLRNEADSLFGSRPDAAGLNKASAPPMASRLGSLRESVSVAHEFASAIESQVERFGAL